MVTARHHACETIASFVLEGFLQAALDDTPEGIEFRDKYVIYAVPFVDKDGCEDGDQGKNRNPHDHNRDYGEESIYPEVQAIMALGEEKRVEFAVDWHCPTLRLADHQGFTLWGVKTTADLNNNVNKWAALVKEYLPDGAPVGPSNWLGDTVNTTLFSDYFAVKKRMIMALTVEVPYAPLGRTMDAPLCSAYGKAMLKAWVDTDFVGPINSLLTVNNGIGGAVFAEGEVINITANPAPAGKVFDAWGGDTSAVPNIYDPTTTVTMPDRPVTLTATYKNPGTLYDLKIVNGTGTGSYSENAVVDISAGKTSGKAFIGWTGDTAAVLDVNSPNTSIIMPATSTYIAANYWEVDDNLLAWWQFEETGADTLKDSAANGYDLSIMNFNLTDNSTTGKVGKGLRFDGSNDKAFHAKLMDQMPNALTISGWVKPDATGMSKNQTFLYKSNIAVNSQMFCTFKMTALNTPGNICFSYRKGSGDLPTLSAGFNWQDDTWYHYAVTWGTDEIRLYIDGVLRAKKTGTGGPFVDGTDQDFFLGCAGSSAQFFKGSVDEIRIFSRALDAQEIQDLYAKNIPSQLTGVWEMASIKQLTQLISLLMRHQPERYLINGPAIMQMSQMSTAPILP